MEIDEAKEAVLDDILARSMTYAYNMRNKRRGVALIFNHKIYDDPKAPIRYGTEHDCAQLQITFTKLGFIVKTYNDYSLGAIESILSECK